MAEGLLRHLGGERFEVHSAGTQATRVRPLAIRAMSELGIDISRQESKSVDRYLAQPFDVVVTVCGEAESCPIPPAGKRVLHWPFPDPAQASGSEAQQLATYRAVRDELRRRIEREFLT
jgi:arsenate reductase